MALPPPSPPLPPQVDTSAANSTSEGLMWLRLVQSARDKEEQNLEAYVKNGQLFYRSLRRIEKDEELLVWYGKDLIDLLLLSSSRAPVKSKGEENGLHRFRPRPGERAFVRRDRSLFPRQARPTTPVRTAASGSSSSSPSWPTFGSVAPRDCRASRALRRNPSKMAARSDPA